jgi:hypothetical protein
MLTRPNLPNFNQISTFASGSAGVPVPARVPGLAVRLHASCIGLLIPRLRLVKKFSREHHPS